MQTRSDSSGSPMKATGTSLVRAQKKTETSGDLMEAAELGYVDVQSSTFRCQEACLHLRALLFLQAVLVF